MHACTQNHEIVSKNMGIKILLLFNRRFDEFLVIPGSGGKELLWDEVYQNSSKLEQNSPEVEQNFSEVEKTCPVGEQNFSEGEREQCSGRLFMTQKNV